MTQDNFGYSVDAGAWMHAKHFSNVGDARRAIEDPSWHNDPDGVRCAKPVKLGISVEILKPKESQNAEQK